MQQDTQVWHFLDGHKFYPTLSTAMAVQTFGLQYGLKIGLPLGIIDEFLYSMEITKHHHGAICLSAVAGIATLNNYLPVVKFIEYSIEIAIVLKLADYIIDYSAEALISVEQFNTNIEA